ncbi:MAG: hypothetical protein K0S71_2245 [Clostridia bacterium]|nr:hypothetical protein [Clostridia bacterium]
MKMNKNISKLTISLMASFAILVGSTSAFAASTSTCTPTAKTKATVCKMKNGKCTTPAACKKQAACKTSTACKSAKACKTAKACKASAVKAPVAAKAPAATKAPTTTTKTPAATPSAPTTTTNSSVSAYENKVLELVNVERQKAGLAALKMDAALSNVARMKSADMQAKKYFDHTSPTYGSPFDMMKKFGITYKTAGENIAMGQRTPEEVVKAWMNSPGHRANILKASFTHIGVGYVANGNYWTQMFVGR